MSRWLFITIIVTQKECWIQCFIFILIDPNSTLEIYWFFSKITCISLVPGPYEIYYKLIWENYCHETFYFSIRILHFMHTNEF